MSGKKKRYRLTIWQSRSGGGYESPAVHLLDRAEAGLVLAIAHGTGLTDSYGWCNVARIINGRLITCERLA